MCVCVCVFSFWWNCGCWNFIDFGGIVQELNIAESEVEDLVVSLILDKKIDGKIAQVNQRIELHSQ